MKRTSGLIVMAAGILVLSRVVSAHIPHTSGSDASARLSKTSVVPADDSGDDGDDSDADDAD